MSFTPEPVRPVRQEVEAQLREAILSGELSEGDKLPTEPELAKMFSVSRSTVREALRSLAVTGMIERVPGSGGGTFVRAMGADQLSETLQEAMALLVQLGQVEEGEIVDVRSLLEVPACRLAAVHRTREDLDELWEIIEREKASSIDDPAVPELDLLFHSGVARASGNRVLAALVHALHRGARPVAHLDLRPEVGRATVRQHIALAHALEDGDAEAAEAAMNDHLSYLRKRGLSSAETRQRGS
jgi:GntR family transcriptional repressor for pyruvate dehydrogenase complex